MSPGRSVTRFLGALVFAISLGAFVAGCGTDVLNPQDDPRPPTWSYIYPAIIQPSCATASCHSDFTARSGVSLGYNDGAYYQLVCRHFVVGCMPNCPGEPAYGPDCMTRAVDDSQLLHQLRADGAPRMPPDFALPDVDIRLISTWISLGAQEN
jgi:hypothetical protein